MTSSIASHGLSRPSRLRRVARGLSRGLGWLLLGLLFLIAALLVAINVTPLGGVAAARVNRLLQPTFQGQLLVQRLGQIGLNGISGAQVEVLDPKGRSVLVAQNIDVRLFWPAVAVRAVLGGDPLQIPIRRITVERVQVEVIDDGSGTPTLAQAFEPREAPTTREPTSTSLVIEQLSVASTHLQGALASVGPIDTDLNRLDASLRNDSRGLALTLRNLEIGARQLPQVQELRGRLTGELLVPAEGPPPEAGTQPVAADRIRTETHALRPAPEARRILLQFAGDVAGSGVEAELRWIGEDLMARLQAARLSPETLTRIIPGLEPRAPVALDARVAGPLDDLGLDAQIQQQQARISAHAKLRGAAPNQRATVRLEASNIDLSQLLAGAPPSAIQLEADAKLDSDAAGSRGSYRLVSAGSRIAGEGVPEATLAGEFALPEQRPRSSTGTLEIAEPGAHTLLNYSVRSGPAGSSAEIVSTTRLDHAPRLRERLGIDGRGSISLRAAVDSGQDELDAELGVRMNELHHPSFSAARLTADVTARGSLAAPELQLNATAQRLNAAGRALRRVWLSARGTPERAVINVRASGQQPERIELSATLQPRSVPQLLEPRVRVSSGTEQLLLAAHAVGFTAGHLAVDRLSLDGAGHADLSLRYGTRLEQLDLSARQLDGARVLRALGVQSQLRSGWLDLDAHVSNAGHSPSGRLRAQLHQFGYAELTGAVHADISYEHGKLNGSAAAELMPGGTTQIALRDLALPLGPIGARDLQRMSGEVSLEGELALSHLQSLLPLVHIERAEGKLRYDVALEGSGQRGEPPGLRAHVESQGLVLIGERADASQSNDAQLARETAPWSLRGIDLNVDFGLERNAAHVRGKLVDAEGELVSWIGIWDNLPARRALLIPNRVLLAAPFTAEVRMPARALEKLPPALRPSDIEGNLQLALDADGSLLDPRVQVRATLERFSPASDRQRKAQLDVNLDAEYTSAGGRVAVTALRRRTESVLELDSRWSGDARQLLEAQGENSPVQGHVELALNEFPVGVVPQLQQRHVRGRVSGTARLNGFGKDARVELDLRTHQLMVERLAVGELHAVARNTDGKLELTTSLAGKAGQLEAQLSAPLVWGGRMLPVSDGQLDGTFQARELRLSALGPLLEGTVSELDGKLDAELQAQFRGEQTQITGSASLREGVLHIPSVGQRFTDIEADLELTPGIVQLQSLKARGLSGGFEASARAVLDGLSPRSAQAKLSIKEKNKLPLTLEGESMGDIWGNLAATYERQEANHTNRIQVKLDNIHVQLPEAPPQGLQPLEQPEYIRVGYRRRDREFTPIALQLLEEPKQPSDEQTLVDVDLGTVSVEKGQQAKLELSGKVQATLGDELDVQGRIDTKRGELDISGKTFEIERASVSFTGGKPDDPTIGAVARYDSPAGYSVYAEYTGTATKGKLALRAEPPLGQDEIVTLLLFGTPDGSLGAGGGDSLSAAMSVAGDTAAQGLNRAISNVTDLDVSARVDTSTGAPRPELVLQLTPRIAAKVTQALGEPVPGQSPDRTFVTIDLRLASNWSLSTMVGDRGASAFDLIWRRRY